MSLPNRVRVGVVEFIFWQIIAGLIGLALAFGPSTVLWHFLAPNGFFQRLITLGCCAGLFIPCGVGGFFIYATINEKTTGL